MAKNNSILVVDDEQAVLETLSKAFCDKGFKVLTADSGEGALKLVRRRIIKVMFLDLKLPGMNGVELCRRIKERNPISCIFAVTGYRSLFELADCREAGFDDYFTKPVKLKLLLKTAQEAFERLERWTKL